MRASTPEEILAVARIVIDRMEPRPGEVFILRYPPEVGRESVKPIADAMSQDFPEVEWLLMPHGYDVEKGE